MTSCKRQHEPAHTHQCEHRESISSQIQRSREAVQTLRASIRLRLGFRTAWEIGTERYALKALRGDVGPIRHQSASPFT